MGIKLYSAHALAGVLGQVPPQKQLLTLGVQECYFSEAQARRLLKKSGDPGNPPGAAAGRVGCRRFFELLGFSASAVQTMDVNAYEGAEILVDLNLPLAGPVPQQFDYIYDGGTLEHVFDLPQALVNLNQFCKVGGMIVHCVPVDWPHHGFVNFTPEFFRAFYLNHGYVEVKTTYLVAAEDERAADRRYRQVPEAEFEHVFRPRYRTELLAAYKKVKEGVAYVPPQQGRYLAIWSGSSERPRPDDSIKARTTLIQGLVAVLERRMALAGLLKYGPISELFLILSRSRRGIEYRLGD